MSRSPAARTERVSVQTLRERAAKIAALRTELARTLEEDRECAERSLQDELPVPTTDHHLAASLPSHLATKTRVHSQALLNTLHALSHASTKIDASAAALDADTRLHTLLAQASARRRMIFSELTRLFRVQYADPGRPGAETADVQSAELARIESYWSGDAETHPRERRDTHPRVVVTINECTIDPSTWKHAFDDASVASTDSSPTADRDTSIALGYAAEIVSIAGRILDVPLRYPVVACGSQSKILDETAGKEFSLFVDERSGGSKGDGRGKFAIGVFLLNKDILQLLASVPGGRIGDGGSSDGNPQDHKDCIGANLVRLLSM